MNINWGLFPEVDLGTGKVPKSDRRLAKLAAARAAFAEWRAKFPV
jgi:hypothetical protein